MVGSRDFEIQLCFQQRHKYKVFQHAVIFPNVIDCWALETDILCIRQKQRQEGASPLAYIPLKLIVQSRQNEGSSVSCGFASNASFIFLLQDLQFHLHPVIIS